MVATSCPKCGNIYATDAKFCRKCGQQRAGMKNTQLTYDPTEMSSLNREDMLIQWLAEEMKENGGTKVEDVTQMGDFEWMHESNTELHRELRQAGAKVTKVACELGFYRLDKREVSLKGAKETLFGTRFFNETQSALVETPTKFATQWHRNSAKFMVRTALKHRQPQRVAIVNPAAEDKPAGGLMQGAWHGVEESLAMQSTLYQSLRKADEIFQVGDIVHVSPHGVKQVWERMGQKWNEGMQGLMGKTCRVETVPEPGILGLALYNQLGGAWGSAPKVYEFPFGVVTKEVENARTQHSHMSEDTDAVRRVIPAGNVLISPNVEFFRGDALQGYPFEPDVVTVGSVLSIPIRNSTSRGQDPKMKRGHLTQKELEEKFELLLYAAVSAGATVLMIPEICLENNRHYKDAEVGRALGSVIKHQFPQAFEEVYVFGRSGFVENAQAIATGCPFLPLERTLKESEEAVENLLKTVQLEVLQQKAQLREAFDAVEACKRDLAKEQEEIKRLRLKELELQRREQDLRRRESTVYLFPMWLRSCVWGGPVNQDMLEFVESKPDAYTLSRVSIDTKAISPR